MADVHINKNTDPGRTHRPDRTAAYFILEIHNEKKPP
jgi:hypothetical protein